MGRDDTKNPCECCEAKSKASGCNGCVLDTGYGSGECQNDKCMVNYECGCLMGLDASCKASTCYEDDHRNHSCGECTHLEARTGKDGTGVTYCALTDEVEMDFDDACEDFEEREDDK